MFVYNSAMRGRYLSPPGNFSSKITAETSNQGRLFFVLIAYLDYQTYDCNNQNADQVTYTIGINSLVVSRGMEPPQTLYHTLQYIKRKF